ncbi:MAG: hypothetical protein Q7T82_14270 [Armatimonadota bacterium]|nr:hypothetical protein [Armatimonadota bacterium]
MEGNETPTAQEQNPQGYISLVVQELKAGTDTWAITQKLVEMGADQSEASQLVDKVYSEVKVALEAEQLTPHSVLTGLVGGALGAAIGGTAWGLIVKYTHFEIGYMAWGIGLLCGFGVVIFSGGRKGLPLQLIAVLAAIAGIVAGKYATFYLELKDVLAQEAHRPVNIPIFSPALIRLFPSALREMMSGFDFLWVALAVITAWRIPKPLGIKLRS